MATLQRLVSKVYESDLEPLSATEIARRDTNAILDADRQQGTQEKHNTTKAASHVSGNPGALRNTNASLRLGYLAVTPPPMWNMSGLFLPGVLLLGYALPDDDIWTAAGRTGTSAGRRPMMMFMARLLTEIAAAIGLRGPPVDSWSPPAYQMAVI